ncbi:MAG: hypothetical protein ISR86_10475 [Nitrospinaceae bacterium]|nr:hypothetical protein [Nitrospinaceae bacterium]
MTEQEQRSTIHYEQAHSLEHQAEDEISFADLLEVLIIKKIPLLAITFICTLFSIYYANTVTPIYRSTISIQEPHETFLASLPAQVTKHLPGGIAETGKTGKGTNPNPNAFAIFLSKVMSYSFKKTVFENGNFFEKFYGKSNTTDIENTVLRIHNSISISKEKLNAELPDFEKPVILEMTGTKPKVMSKFLTALVESAKQATIKELKDLTSLIVKNEISKISREIDFIRAAEEEDYIKDRIIFSEALSTAKIMGIKNNNFDKLRSNNVTVGISSKGRTSFDSGSMALESFLESQEQATIKVQDTTLPVWYLYGEKALLQELNVIKLRKKGAHIPGINLKKISLEKYKNIDPSSLKIKVITISQPSIPPSAPFKPNKRRFILIGMVAGLVISIFMAFMLHSIDQVRKKRLPTTSTGD